MLNDSTVELTNTSLHGSSYYWDFGDGDTSSSAAQVQQHVYQDNGSFTVMLVVTNLCGDKDTAYQKISISGLGINEEAASSASIRILPNPFSHGVKVIFNLPKAEQADIAIYDNLSRKVYELPNKKLAQGSNKIDLSSAFADRPAGIYMISISLRNGARLIRKVVKLQ